MTTEQKIEPVYDKDQIKNAIIKEMGLSGLTAEDRSRLYMVLGIVRTALERFDKENINPLNIGI